MQLRKIARRALSLLLLLCMVLSLVPTNILATEAETKEPWDADGTLSVLAIGNSFSEDTLAHVWDIAKDLGVADIVLGNLSAEEGSLAEHWANAAGDKAAYTYYVNTDGNWSATDDYRMSTALTSRHWDYVVLQQLSDDSGREETYNADLTNLVSYVKALCPTAKLAWNMTWAYQEDSEKLQKSVYDDQESMYRNTASAVMTEIATNSDFDLIIPIGTAVENMRTSLIGDNVSAEDGCHLEQSYGYYLAGLTFVGAITGADVWECNWLPEDVPFALQVLSMESAANAIADPYTITYSQHPDVETSILYETAGTRSQSSPSGDDFYARIYPQWTRGAYWRTEDRNNTSSVVTDGAYSPFYWSTLRYTQSFLPVGTVILQSSDFHYRMEKWSTSNPNGKQPSRGPVKTATHYVITADDWNGMHYIGFNVGFESQKDIKTDTKTYTKEWMNSKFKIYYPIGAAGVAAGNYNATAARNLYNTSKYVRIKYGYNKSSYWYCTHSTYWNQLVTSDKESNAPKFFCTQKFNDTTLPNGSIIFLESGWKWRADVWGGTTSNVKKLTLSFGRPNENVERFVRISDAFWRGDPEVRAFNISTTGEANLSNYTNAQLESAFRIYLPASQHTHSWSVSSTVAATCTAAGSKNYSCSGCHTTKSETITMLGHLNDITLAAKDPTCTETGLTAGVKCSRCNQTTTVQNVIPAKGHSYVAVVSPSYTTYTCSVCGDSYIRALPTATNGAIGTEVADLGPLYISESGGTHNSTNQGLAIAGDYAYTSLVRKGPRDADGKREILYTELFRIDLRTGEKKLIVSDPYGTEGNIGLMQATDMAAVCYGDYTYLFVAKERATVNLLKLDANGVIQDQKVITWSNAPSNMSTSDIAITSFENGIVELLVSRYNNFYTTEIDLNNISESVAITAAFTLDEAEIGSVVESYFAGCGSRYVDGGAGWSYQGISYNRTLQRIYMPLITTETVGTGHEYRGMMIVMDDSGNIVPEECFAIHEYSLAIQEIDFYGPDMYWGALCYTPINNDNNITEANRIYKMPMQYFDGFSDATQEIEWWNTNNRVTGWEIADDCLNLTIPDYADSSYPWIRNNLRILFNQAECMAIRFQVEDCVLRDGDKQTIRFTVSPDASNWEYVEVDAEYVDGWYVAVLDMDAAMEDPKLAAKILAMKQMEVKYLQLMFRSLDGGLNGDGKIKVDYIYIGPKDDAPDTSKLCTVKFVNHDGTLLQEVVVQKGTSAVYTGETPTKAFNEDYHYIFSNWDKSLENITSDMTVTAVFSEISHNYSCSSESVTHHRCTCECGHFKTEEHSYTYVTTDTEHKATCACGYTVALPTATNGAVGKEVANFGPIYIPEAGGSHVFSIQGMAIAGNYAYTALQRKGARDSDGNRESLYTELYRIDLRTGEKKLVVTDYYNDPDRIGLGHCNDMTAVCYGDDTYVFVTRGKRSVTMLKIDAEGTIQQTSVVVWTGSTAELKAEIAAETMATTGVMVTSCEDGIASLLIANYNRFYTAEVNLESMSLHSSLVFAFELDEAQIGSAVESVLGGYGSKYVDGSSGWGYQGISYNRDTNKIYLPVSIVEALSVGHEYRSMVVVIDEDGTILPTESFAVKEYSLEPEAIDFYGSEMYFSTMCYEAVENDCNISEANRIYKMPLVFFDGFSDDTQTPTWKVYGKRVTNMEIADDCLNLTVANSTDNGRPWIRNSMRILFNQADIMAVRFQVSGCDVPADGSQTVSFSVSTDASQWEGIKTEASFIDGYYVAVAEPTEAMKLMEAKYLQIIFHDVNGVDENSLLKVDYAYVGPGHLAPDTAKYYTVKFVNEDGTLLDSLRVLSGTEAFYSGETPVKAPDSEYHYNFTGWDLPFDRVTSDLTLTAQFEAILHNEVTDEAVDATCTTTGLTEGKHCGDCGLVLVPQQETPALGHTHAAPVNNGNGTHSSICHCGDTITEPHSFDENGNCICGASNKVGNLEADAIDVVIDYARPVEVSVRNRAFITAVTEDMLAKAPMTVAESDYGTVTAFDSDEDGLDDSLRFVPKGFLPGIVTVNCTFTVNFASLGLVQDVIVPVRFIPATSVYYETDFSNDALTRYPEADWVLKGETEEKDQDSGIIKENIYDFLFDRGGEIPSNAFFADFSNDAVDVDRYSKDTIYRDVGQDNAYFNYDELVDGNSYAKNWCYDAAYTARPVIDQDNGTMTVKLAASPAEQTAFVQTGSNLESGLVLNYLPQPEHYLQIRFKLKGVVPTNANGKATLRLTYHVPAELVTDTSRYFTAGETEIPAEAFTEDEYVTLSLPLSNLGGTHLKIDALRINFVGIDNASSSSKGSIIFDYIYCGPSASENDAAAIDHEYTYAPYLLFDFVDDTFAKSRYADAAYGGITDYDTSKTRWMCSTYDPETRAPAEWEASGISSGIISFKVGRRRDPDRDNIYSNYFAPTKTTGDYCFPWKNTDDIKDYPLEFNANQNVNYYGIVRFKTANMIRSGGIPEIRFFLRKTDGTTVTAATSAYSPINGYEDGKYFVVKVDLTERINDLGGKIDSFCISLDHVTSATTTSTGTVTFDYIYIGPYEGADEDAANAIKYSTTGEKNVFIGFDNRVYDQARYRVARTYGMFDFDNRNNWKTDANDFTLGRTNSGILRLTRAANYDNYGTLEFKVANNQNFLSYRMTGNDYAVIRMKHTGLNTTGVAKPIFSFIVGSGDTYRAPAATASNHCKLSYPLSADRNGKWFTYVIDLSEAKAALGSRITYFSLAFSAGLDSTATFEIDYIYIGSKLLADAPEDSLYFGFDNTTADRERYSTASYGGIQYDTEGAAKFTLSSSLASGTVSNQNGVMTLTAAEGSTATTFYFQPANTLSYHTKSKAVQIRFKMENFAAVEGTAPYFVMRYGSSNTNAAEPVTFDAKYLSKGRYITLTVDLNENDAPEFTALNAVSKLRFLFGGMKNADGAQGKITVDYVYVGPKDGKLGGEMTYGYDSHYTSDNGFSGGSSYFVNGKGVPNLLALKDENGQYVRDENNQLIITGIDYPANGKYTEATFTFTGKGFDLIGNTGPEQGSVRAAVFDKETGKFVKSTQVVCTSESGKDVTQVPVISMTLDAHGTYTVKISVAEGYKNDDFPFLNRGGEFHFDAIRIYDTVNTEADTLEAEIATDVYRKHGEAHAEIEEIRQYLIDAQKFSQLEGSTEGAIFLDNTSKEVTVSTYQELGPNNEVYLNSGFAISFLLEASYGIPASVDIGAKLVDGTASQMGIAVGAVPTAVTDKSQSCSITTKTTQNYAIKLEDSNWYAENGKYYTYVTISNTGDGILSLTDLKIAYHTASKPAGKSVRLLVNRDMLNTLPTVDESLTFGANLVLENDLTMNFRVRADKLAAYDLSTAYLVVERDIYESGAKEAFVETVTIREYQMEDGRLIFSYPGIAAAQMNDAIRATLYVKTERGKEYYSTTLNTSVATYLNGLLSASASDTKLITLLMDMVNYGAAAQIYFDRHADAPVNEAFESFKTYASYASADFKTALENLSATENAEGKSGKLNLGLDLGTRIGIQYKVTVPADVNVEDVTLVVTDASGNVLETLTVAGNPKDNKGRYVVNFYGFTSRDMRRVVYATAYANGEAITGTYAYSISSYAYGMQENAATQPESLVNVTRAMMLYGDSAAAYFA